MLKAIPDPNISSGVAPSSPTTGKIIPSDNYGKYKKVSTLPIEDRITRRSEKREYITKEQAEKIKDRAAKEQTLQPLTSLGAYVKRCWEQAVTAKSSSGITEILMQCLRQRKGEYDPDVLANIKRHRGSKVFMRLTTVKCRALESLMSDVFLPAGEKPWSLSPTPRPDLPTDKMNELIDTVTEELAAIIQQTGTDQTVSDEQIIDRVNELKQKVAKEQYGRALAACKELETYIEDELVEGGFYDELEKFIKDLSTYPTAFLKGPIVKLEPTLEWTHDGNGNYIPIVTKKYRRVYRRISPFDIYPSPNAKNIQDGYLCEHVAYSRESLQSMIGAPGWSESAIRAVLMESQVNASSIIIPGEETRKRLENRGSAQEAFEKPIEGFEFHGPISGQLLLEWGLSPELVPDYSKYYNCVVVMLGRWVVMARINPHPFGRRPYYAASYDSSNDSVWGEGPPQLMRDTQRICNALARAIVNNAGIASGPQVELDFNRLLMGQDTTSIWPWRIWLTKESRQPHGKPAIQFFQPNMMVRQLLAVFQYFFDQASEQSGIPAYVYGNMQTSGAGNTASGLSMLLNAASKMLKNAVRHVDRNVIKKVIYEHWLNVMLYDEDAPKYGDANVVARASEYLVVQEQLQLRRKEFLDSTNNPIDLSIIGKEGRAALLREQAKSLKLPHIDIVPTREELIQQEMEAAAAAAEQQAAAQGAIPMPEAGPGHPPLPAQATMSPDGGIKGKEPGRTMEQNP